MAVQPCLELIHDRRTVALAERLALRRRNLGPVPLPVKQGTDVGQRLVGQTGRRRLGPRFDEIMEVAAGVTPAADQRRASVGGADLLIRAESVGQQVTLEAVQVRLGMFPGAGLGVLKQDNGWTWATAITP